MLTGLELDAEEPFEESLLELDAEEPLVEVSVEVDELILENWWDFAL